MNAAKHTPGPFAHIFDANIKVKGPTHIIHASRTAVCFVPAWTGSDEGAAEAEANRDMFAAAPDMLEALKSILTANVDGKNVERYLDAIDIARAAIAKAEGRSDG